MHYTTYLYAEKDPYGGLRVEKLIILVLFLFSVGAMWKAGSALSRRMLEDAEKRDDFK
jgi:hypothetical protein